MAELRDQVSQYIGFKPNEICLLITEEDKQDLLLEDENDLGDGLQNGFEELKADFRNIFCRILNGFEELKANFKNGFEELKANFKNGFEELKVNFKNGFEELKGMALKTSEFLLELISFLFYFGNKSEL
ncbi:hypothetical protein C1645_811683 [Glomus cerebriforme]|uniref:Uncharacterized protein n=1 Tax=Glomus cerebriforme TaxID=658196 RepID=A0A397TVL5_9GLOM|nr:hypothetical protein C1645_811683 [Glomus cerebriforme]